MPIRYTYDQTISREQFIDLLKRSTLAERRPIGDFDRIDAMLRHANLLCTAWDAEDLVGVARSITDFEYCCYLSDLAVDAKYHKRGIGKSLIHLTQSQLGAHAKIILLSAPNAVEFYPKIGFEPHNSAWILSAKNEME
ncbi:MAG: GNAT family N-acetyltransferase [Spirulinaceae cyanobacterium RM2_2_10]|nr:GNAT family N-acetyltransferase [Spirulinaceae cyanobacterium RM2_2_10]